MILAGDIGGTNTRLALIDQDQAGQLQPRHLDSFPSANYAGLEAVVREYLAKYNVQVPRACFGVAGPVRDQRCKARNLPWVVDAQELAAATGIERVAVINDLEANTYGIPCLGPEAIVTINPGVPGAVGNWAVISAGTGLGEAGAYWDGQTHHPFATEGGHTDFAPRNRLEYELYEYLLQLFGHVSYERVVSGPGLVNIYRFLVYRSVRDTGRSLEPPWLAEELDKPEGDDAATIAKAARTGDSPLAIEALDLFLELYGAEAGNMALKVMARGGVWLGGGIVVKELERLQRMRGRFLAGFAGKGRTRDELLEMPVRVINKDTTALLGAGRYAWEVAWPSS